MIQVHHVKDGVDCMTFSRKEGEYVNVPTPDLILLDLNMPRKNGCAPQNVDHKTDGTLRSLNSYAEWSMSY
jgi:CheY-like chemotaxis protein